jgi:glutamate synthase domain-containing protein 2
MIYFLVYCVVVIAAVFAALQFFKDKHQRKHSLLVNYPVIGHARYLFERVGKYLRQYWFTNDNEERPFSRSTRSQVYRMSKDIKNVLSFGSTREMQAEVFSPSMFPLESHESDIDRVFTIGKDCEMPVKQTNLVNISGMSFGALSGNAIRALSLGAQKAGISLNTGEGGKPSKYHGFDGDSNLVLQLGTANFGYRNEDGTIDYKKLAEVRDSKSIEHIQVKLSQGAKPNRGGLLPGVKVTEEIAELRGVEPFKDCISPCKNPDCDTPEKLLNTILKIKKVTGKPVGIKLALAKIDDLEKLLKLAIKMQKGNDGRETFYPSVITIDGGDGGSGAAPAVFMESVALPVKNILPEVHSLLVKLGLKSKIGLVASGKLVTAHDAALAFTMGADWIETARGFLMAIGCINANDCYLGTCPVGIATQDPVRQRALDVEDKALRVANYAVNLESEIFDLALACGVSHPRDLKPKHVVEVNSNRTNARGEKIMNVKAV